MQMKRNESRYLDSNVHVSENHHVLIDIGAGTRCLKNQEAVI